MFKKKEKLIKESPYPQGGDPQENCYRPLGTCTVKVHVDADTTADVTVFLEICFKLYSTATETELAYNVKVKVTVKLMDNQTKVTLVSQYELTLHKDSNWKIIQ